MAGSHDHRHRALWHAPDRSPATRGLRSPATRGLRRSVGDWGVACDGAERALQLLPDVAWRGLGWPSREERLTGAADLVADAVTAALQRQHPVAAARFSEQGRSLLWAQMLQLRGDLDAVSTVDPALAERLDEVRRQLDIPG